jgi:putative redox protein
VTEVRTKLIEGMRFVAIPQSGHAMVMDTDKDKGGFDSAPKPMELLLASLAGCTAMDVIYILRKMKIEPKEFEVVVKSERAEGHPKVYKKTAITYLLRGKDIPENKVKQAIELSQNKYCPVSATMKTVGEITYNYKIVE